ncbi:MAG: flagellar assembly protein FliW [Butyrivibrio sp.]|nr:flagellar assembly protein FliW [Butyrivibrio sp.]
MHIDSRVFGEIDIDDDKIIRFEDGVIGFEEYHNYALIYDEEKKRGANGGIMWLQCMDEPDLAFPVADPLHIYPGYNPVVEDEWLASIGEFNDAEDIFLLSILTVPSDITKVTANLKAPVIINMITRKACQTIVNNEEYEIKYNIYDYVQSLKKKEAE